MKEQFVPYELALKLKELGFDEECLRWFDDNGEFVTTIAQNLVCRAPLWQQAFDWLWNKTNKYIISIPNDDKKWLCSGTEFDTYEEARLECLKKLIEICKTL